MSDYEDHQTPPERLRSGGPTPPVRRSPTSRRPAPRGARRDFLRRLSLFLQAMNELAPLLIALQRLPREALEASDDPEDLVDLCRVHHTAVTVISERWGIDPTDATQAMMHRRLRRTVSRLLASDDMLGRLHGFGSTPIAERFDELAGIVERLCDDRDIENEALSLTSPEDEALSDSVLNLKMALFPVAHRMDRLCAALSLEHVADSEAARATDLIVDLCRDLAHNWSERSTTEDRQGIFDAAAPHVAEIVFETWQRTLLDQICEDAGAESATLEELCSDLLDAAHDLHMGYDEHPDFGLDYLDRRLIDTVARSAQAYDSQDIPSTHRVRILNAAVFGLQKIAARAWRQAADRMIEQINDLSEEEFQRWSSEKGQQPMDFRLFESHFSDLLRDEAPWQGLTVDWDILADTARTRLANLWGLSDAYCKVST